MSTSAGFPYKTTNYRLRRDQLLAYLHAYHWILDAIVLAGWLRPS
jgi:hypothetical protein